jgi:hypothetical protein
MAGLIASVNRLVSDNIDAIFIQLRWTVSQKELI